MRRPSSHQFFTPTTDSRLNSRNTRFEGACPLDAFYNSLQLTPIIKFEIFTWTWLFMILFQKNLDGLRVILFDFPWCNSYGILTNYPFCFFDVIVTWSNSVQLLPGKTELVRRLLNKLPKIVLIVTENVIVTRNRWRIDNFWLVSCAKVEVVALVGLLSATHYASWLIWAVNSLVLSRARQLCLLWINRIIEPCISWFECGRIAHNLLTQFPHSILPILIHLLNSLMHLIKSILRRVPTRSWHFPITFMILLHLCVRISAQVLVVVYNIWRSVKLSIIQILPADRISTLTIYLSREWLLPIINIMIRNRL